MDKRVKIMDGFFKHFGPCERQFPLLAQVESIGFIPAKRERVRRTFDSCNFSFILKGRGDYLLRGKRHPVLAPALLIQWPGEPMNYGPDGEWTELYLIYPARESAQLGRAGLLTPENPVRQLANGDSFAAELHGLLLSAAGDTPADRIDLKCLSLLFAGLTPAGENDSGDLIADVRRELIMDNPKPIDVAGLAARHGMSSATLRRRWREACGDETFSECRNRAFAEAGCRMLVETGLPIKEIADRMGFADQFYFSRKFRREVGTTPSEYRRKHRIFGF